MSKDGEIVGLKGTTNGRTCESHDCCGKYITADDLVRFKLTVVDIDGTVEEAIKVVRVRDGTESCTVGFLPRNIVKSISSKEKFVGQFAQIIELYDQSDNEVMRRKSHRNQGVASFRLLNQIQEQE